MVHSNLARIMGEQGMTLRKLAELSGVAGETVNRARGERIFDCKLSTLAALAAALGVRIKDLFDEDETAPAPEPSPAPSVPASSATPPTL